MKDKRIPDEKKSPYQEGRGGVPSKERRLLVLVLTSRGRRAGKGRGYDLSRERRSVPEIPN